MRVLATTHPASGHLHPLVPLLRGLSERGHEVLAATSRAFCPAVEAVGLPAVAVGYRRFGAGARTNLPGLHPSTPAHPKTIFLPLARESAPHNQRAPPHRPP